MEPTCLLTYDFGDHGLLTSPMDDQSSFALFLQSRSKHKHWFCVRTTAGELNYGTILTFTSRLTSINLPATENDLVVS